jgi:hypothetical protein
MQRSGVEPVLREPRRKHVREQHVRTLDEARQGRHGLGQRQVQCDGALAAVVHVEVGRHLEAAVVPGEAGQAVPVDLSPRHLDLDHLGSEIGEQCAGRRHRDEARQLDDADSRERCGHVRHCTRVEPRHSASEERGGRRQAIP